MKISADQLKAGLFQAGLPEWIAEGLTELQVHYFGPGHGAEKTGDIRQVTGRAPRTFDEFAGDFAKAVGGSSN